MYVIGIKSVDYDEMPSLFDTIYSFAGTAFTKHTIFLGPISCLFSLESSTGLVLIEKVISCLPFSAYMEN